MSRDRSESGFTLVEVLVATVISGIVMGGIAAILIVTLTQYPQSATRISSSGNAQLLSTWLLPDVESADPSGINIGGTTGCLSTPGSVDELQLHWSDYNSTTTFSADYCHVGSELIRYYRQGTGPVTQTVVSRDLAGGPSAVQVTVGSDSVVVSITIQPAGSPPYTFHVSASRRTPALRIFAVPNIYGSTNNPPVKGTAEPANRLIVTIIDQPPKNQAAHLLWTSHVTVGSNGKWSISDIGWTTFSYVGAVNLTAKYESGGDLSPSATTTTIVDIQPLTETVTPQFGTPTSDPTIHFLVTFNRLLGIGQCLNGPNGVDVTVTLQPTGEATVNELGFSTPTGSDGTCTPSLVYLVSVKVLTVTVGPVFVQLKVNDLRVKDQFGKANTASQGTIVWTGKPLTISTPAGNGTPINFGGDDSSPGGPVTVQVCKYTGSPCSNPVDSSPQIAVTGAQWSYTPKANIFSSGSLYYATVTQSIGTNTSTVFSGPFSG